ncbi:MAG: hypothetical protein ACC667_09605, partial [Longimicrobiales bacterium]
DSFRGDKHGRKWKFRAKKPGITEVELKANGGFKVKGKGLDLSGLELGHDNPVNFVLTIGDDFGGIDIPFDRKGKFRRRKHDD